MHLVNDAVTGSCQTALVVTNDSDLEEAVRIASAHVEVVVLNPSRVATNARLLRHAAREIAFDPELLARLRPAGDGPGGEWPRVALSPRVAQKAARPA